ncbi:S-adenosyl-L-methionine-dependent methyltransferase [Diaporthe sp. PMI_573]|jgi:SAM-dependent methyltransferase|nr:S-adenosyl-L-methionine-dependent methyltransferase [Diaporthaceae sp. PMI_573]
MVGTESIVSSSRTESVAESVGGRTIMSSEPPYREGDGSSTRSLPGSRPPFVTKSNGRTYLADPTLGYPLPVDLHELHRQSLRTLLLFQLFGGPLCSPFFNNKPPLRVLDVGCAYGFWSMMCHSYYSRKGFPNVHFTGLDIAALGGIAGMPHVTGPAGGPKDRISSTSTSSSSSTGYWAEQPPDKNMRWNFVQHDVRLLPLPFPEEEFDVIMCKDMSMSIPTDHFSTIIDDFMRILKPGGVVEVWECDHPIRMLRPHVPDTPATGPFPAPPPTPSTEDSAASAPATATDGTAEDKAAAEDTPTTPATPATAHASSKKADYEKEVAELGAYVINNNTPLSGPQNNYLIEYNGWVSKYMDANRLLSFPCANVGALFLQEPLLTNYGSKRLAIPLSEVRWEREGVGGVVTKDGKSYIDTSKAIGKAAAAAAAIMGPSSGSGGGKRGSSAAGGDGDDGPGGIKKGKALSPGQLALRQAALQTVVQFIEGLEPALREVSGKKPDEWDTWMGKLMKELMERDGTSCGECLEVGAWWARKRSDPPP